MDVWEGMRENEVQAQQSEREFDALESPQMFTPPPLLRRPFFPSFTYMKSFEPISMESNFTKDPESQQWSNPSESCNLELSALDDLETLSEPLLCQPESAFLSSGRSIASTQSPKRKEPTTLFTNCLYEDKKLFLDLFETVCFSKKFRIVVESID